MGNTSSWRLFSADLPTRVARFFLVHDTKTGKNVPHENKMHQMVKNIKDVRKIFQMAKKYIHFPNLRPSKIYPKWDFGLKL
jgi:hypothetical protein